MKNPKGDQSTICKSYHSPSVVPGSPLRAPTVTPPVVPTTLPTTPTPVIAPPVIAAMVAEEVMVADLTRHLKQAFEEISLGANYPMPMFMAKREKIQKIIV